MLAELRMGQGKLVQRNRLAPTQRFQYPRFFPRLIVVAVVVAVMELILLYLVIITAAIAIAAATEHAA